MTNDKLDANKVVDEDDVFTGDDILNASITISSQNSSTASKAVNKST